MNRRILKKQSKRAASILMAKYGYKPTDFTVADGAETFEIIYAGCWPRRQNEEPSMLKGTPYIWRQTSIEYDEWERRPAAYELAERQSNERLAAKLVAREESRTLLKSHLMSFYEARLSEVTSSMGFDPTLLKDVTWVEANPMSPELSALDAGAPMPIEPRTTFVDFQREILQSIASSTGLSYDQMSAQFERMQIDRTREAVFRSRMLYGESLMTPEVAAQLGYFNPKAAP